MVSGARGPSEGRLIEKEEEEKEEEEEEEEEAIECREWHSLQLVRTENKNKLDVNQNKQTVSRRQ